VRERQDSVDAGFDIIDIETNENEGNKNVIVDAAPLQQDD
jgi:hypothetical protein